MIRHCFPSLPCMGQNHRSHYAPFQTGGLQKEFISRAAGNCGTASLANATAWNHSSSSTPLTEVCHDNVNMYMYIYVYIVV